MNHHNLVSYWLIIILLKKNKIFIKKCFKILPCQDWVSFPVEVDWWHLIGPLMMLVSFDSHIYKSCLDLFERLPNPTVHLLPVLPSKTSQSL